ncbi:1-acyl-sn-glycerol-3-phosphate acyltransferase [Motilimonas sp. 1_MG-2023]|uniref:1-acyl-sn-glycerol-3-phosphate acyltransferase n=1 Tax=Motilimonas sp. 1_MG-2023 TaxID=3062672 RepID=UPI0026E48CC9|nr:1-acyl-sn-glycerol-3-phosphate acyltransferase [Motilimonas sp. 1_MG-2023]MDO6525206.1 1-acyl-sn-glycerol-3-phosphate acyltransferase [Motilimonas sp. 1_MG-2023]
MATETTGAEDIFADIRPYNDDEIAGVIQRITHDDEFIAAMTKVRFPRLSGWAPWLMRPIVKQALSKKWAGLDSVDKVQAEVAAHMQSMVTRTTSKVTFTGLEQLQRDQAYLFVSNHRDIAMDPAFVNWGLFHNNFGTVRIAIGDNLLKKPYVTDLMKLNKSFIVKRSATAPRAMMAAFSHLSAYIKDSLNTGNNIWIAQKEGRAKDGFDKTDPAIIKMFYMHGKKQKIPFADYVKQLKIVPVAISYEFDPGDVSKAKELYATEQHGKYEKSEFEDIVSITEGITGKKGHVHIAFGQPLQDDYDDADSVAAAIDDSIYRHYYLHPSNLLAAKVSEADKVSLADRQAFEEHMNKVPEELRERVLTMYAQPVFNRANLSV